MTARDYMIMGSLGGAVLIAIFMFTPFASGSIGVFAFGAIFGKGYGIWEERTRASPESEVAK